MDGVAHVPWVLGLVACVLLLLAWLIGVQGILGLISSYRAHPERYPDGAGLGRWMAWTLAFAGASFGACALALAGGGIPITALGPWTLSTSAFLIVGALGGLARYRRMPPAHDAQATSPRRRR